MSVPFTGSNGRAAGQGEPGIDDISLKAKVAEVLDRWPSAGLAAGVVRDGGLEWFMGHGVADVGSKTPVTKDTVFRIGSITKTFTAIAVMQLYERGLVDLDAPANDYLRCIRLIPANACAAVVLRCDPVMSIVFSCPAGLPLRPLRHQAARKGAGQARSGLGWCHYVCGRQQAR